MNNKLRKIINNYGIKKQLKYFQTEIFELTEAIITKEDFNPIREIAQAITNAFTLGTSKDNEVEHIKEEIADVMVMLKQFQLFYNISTESIEEVMKTKIDRQLERIEEANLVKSMIPVIEPIKFDSESTISFNKNGIEIKLKDNPTINIVVEDSK